MKISLSKNVSAMEPSVTLSISATAKAMIRAGEDVVNFSVGEPDFDTPDYIKDAAVRALHEGKTKYTPAAGIDELRQAICDKYNKENGVVYQPKDVVASTGGKQALYNTFLALLDPGDEVLIPIPYWTSYPEMVTLVYGKNIFVETEERDDYKVRVDLLNRYVTEKTKALVLNSPSNPSGVVYTREELLEIGKWAVDRGIVIVADEMYERLVYDGEYCSIASLNEEIKNHTVTINGFSKAYAMTGWRLGYTATSVPGLSAAISAIQSHVTSNPNSITQYAALAALNSDSDALKEMFLAFRKRRNLIVDLVKNIDGVDFLYPAGAFYLMVDISYAIGKEFRGKRIRDDADFASFFLEDYKVATTPGKAFGLKNFIRISYATSEDRIREGMKRLENFLNEMNVVSQ